MEIEKKSKKMIHNKKSPTTKSKQASATSTLSNTSSGKKQTSKKPVKNAKKSAAVKTIKSSSKKTTESSKTNKSTPKKTTVSKEQSVTQETINAKEITGEQKLDETLNNNVSQELIRVEEHSMDKMTDNNEVDQFQSDKSDGSVPIQDTVSFVPSKKQEENSIIGDKDAQPELRSETKVKPRTGTHNSMQTFIDIDRSILNNTSNKNTDIHQLADKNTKKSFGKIKSLIRRKNAKKDDAKDSSPIQVTPNVPSADDIEKEILEQYSVVKTQTVDVDYIHDKKVTLPEQIKLQEEFFHYNFTKLEKSETLTLSVDNLYKRFGRKQAVNGVSFDIHTGEVVGFLGPNGAGKTTVFYMIVGFLTPDHGTILFNNVSMEKLPMYKRARLGISYLLQESSVFRRLTVEKNIIAVLQTIKGITDDERRERLENLIYEFGLGAYRKQRAYTLSGGERRRTEIARGMALHPYFLLLDEPFTGIDPKARFELKQIIKALSEKGVGVLITDHNERDTLSITDRAFILHNGDIVAQGTREEIMNNVKVREIYLGEEYN